MRSASHPAPQGMYDPRNEHDACGVGFVATLTGEASHELVEAALTVLRNMEHRGATGSDPDSGDGAGILMQIPDAFLRESVAFPLPEPGAYAVGIAFLPADAREAADAVSRIETIAAEEGLAVLGWREVPVAPRAARHRRPRHHARLPAAVRHRRREHRPPPRPQGLRPAQARRARGGHVLPLPLRPHHRLQGHAHHGAAGAVLPRPLRPALRHHHRARPLPLLHQHLPLLAARPPLPLRRPQR
ncbi:hypothetical protein GCM10020000_60680 [Streptomyces olivoverticillatus]